jgi:hypothetical protein
VQECVPCSAQNMSLLKIQQKYSWNNTQVFKYTRNVHNLIFVTEKKGGKKMWKHTTSYKSTSKSLDLENRITHGQASKQGNMNFEN